jgi:putative transposase
LKRKHGGYGETFFIEEVFVKINGKRHYRDLRISAFGEWSRAVAWN